MPKTVIFLLMILLALTGWYVGYSQGVKNQIFFDGSAKTSLYEKALLSYEYREDILNAFLFRQRCILSLRDEYKTTSIIHPIHKEAYEYYKFNLERLCENGKCNCEYPPKL